VEKPVNNHPKAFIFNCKIPFKNDGKIGVILGDILAFGFGFFTLFKGEVAKTDEDTNS
jgi:hypothetical protein